MNEEIMDEIIEMCCDLEPKRLRIKILKQMIRLKDSGDELNRMFENIQSILAK